MAKPTKVQQTPVPKPDAKSRKPYWAAVGLALLTLLAYSNSFGAGFVFDNRAVILEDARLRALTASNLDLILHRSYWWPIVETPLYRPATTLSYLVNYTIFGNADRPVGYHVVNWLIHTVNVWLVYILALRIGRRVWPALFLAAIWAVHPVGTEAVTNIVGRADLLAAFGVLGTFYAHLLARDNQGPRRWAWSAVALIAMTLGVFAKESAVAGVGVIALYDVIWRERDTILKSLASVAILVIPVLWLLYARSTVLSGGSVFPYVDNPISGAGFVRGRLTALSVMARYLVLLVWPARLSADYSFAQIPLATGSLADWLSWIAVLGLAAASVAAFKIHRLLFFCLVSAFVCFMPSANVIFAAGTIMAERLMYLPSVFLLAALVIVAYYAALRVGVDWPAPAVLTVAIVLSSFRTFARNDDWHDDLSLWTATAAASPQSFKSHASLAEALYRADASHGNLDRVIEEKEKSLAILKRVPDRASISRPYWEAATYYLERGDWLEAHRGTSDEISTAYRRAAALGEEYLQLLKERPVSAKETSEAELLVATAYGHFQQGDKALTAARLAVEDQPFNPLSYRALAAALLSARRSDEAAIELMSGFMLTGNQELRSALLDLYRGGLDVKGCATTSAGSTVSLNLSCEIVRGHLCAAAARATALQQRTGRADLAAQVSAVTQDAHCGR